MSEPVRRDVPTLAEVTSVIDTAWCGATCQERKLFMATNPAFGQSAATAVMVRRLFGGVVIKTTVEVKQLKGKVPETPWVLRHYYNRLPSGEEVDLTRGQFPRGTKFNLHEDEPRVREVPFGPDVLKRAVLLEKRVYGLLKRDWGGPTPQHKAAGQVTPTDEEPMLGKIMGAEVTDLSGLMK